MELDDDYKFAMDCEINPKFRRTDAIRSQLLQLHALRAKIDIDVLNQRQADLMQEYSFEVDREDGNNTFINSAKLFAQNSRRPNVQHKWRSIFKKRLDEGMSAAEIVESLNPKLKPIMELSKKFRNSYKNRVIDLETEEAPETEDSSQSNKGTSSQDSKSSESGPNNIVNFIQKKMKPNIASSPTRSNLAKPQSNGSPTRVSGIFRKKSTNGQFQPPLFSSADNSNASYANNHRLYEPSTSSGSSFGRPLPIRNPEPIIEQENEPRRSLFMSGLEKHLTDQVMNNRMSSDQARKIVQEVRTTSSFKNPMVKLIDNKEKKENGKLLLDDERLKGIDKAMVEMIQSEIVSNLENTDWANIAGLEAAKSKIKQIAILPLIRPDLFTGVRAPPKGILLFGPPGTGKTMIGRCIASQAKATFFSVTASTLTSKWIGEGEKAMKTLFILARIMKPAVIFIDEVDSLLKSRCDSEHEASRRMKTEFLSQFDGLSSESNDGLLVIGTTNRPQELDEAARRRFAARIFISLPEKAARKYMIKSNLKGEVNNLTEEELEMIAEKTEGFSGSDMKHLCTEAAMISLKEVMDQLVNMNKSDIRAICRNDFLHALDTIKPSFSTDDLQEYTDWNKKYGAL